LNKTGNWSSGIFEDMVNKGLISTSSSWLTKAIEQKHNRLAIGVANSRLLFYDHFDRNILKISNLN
jgi:hypothetical protein